MKKKLALEEGLRILKQGIAKAMLILDGYATNALFTCEEYMKLYDCVYEICCQNYSNEYCNQLYELFKKALEESITSRVIPALKDKTNVSLLNELCNMWGKYKVMAKCLGGFFLYLDRFFVEDGKTAPLNHLSICCFHDLINQDRDDENSACSDLLKNVSTFFVEIGNGKMHCHDNFETALLSSTAMYYKHLVSKLLLHNTPMEYMMKAQHCFSQEKERASQFLTQTSVEKLLKVVEEQLLGETAVNVLNSYGQHKADGDGLSSYQDMLQRCAGLNLGEGSSER